MKMRHVLCVLLCNLFSSIILTHNDDYGLNQEPVDYSQSPLRTRGLTSFPSVGSSVEELTDLQDSEMFTHPQPPHEHQTTPLGRQAGCPTSPPKRNVQAFPVTAAFREACARRNGLR